MLLIHIQTTRDGCKQVCFNQFQQFWIDFDPVMYQRNLQAFLGKFAGCELLATGHKLKNAHNNLPPSTGHKLRNAHIFGLYFKMVNNVLASPPGSGQTQPGVAVSRKAMAPLQPRQGELLRPEYAGRR